MLSRSLGATARGLSFWLLLFCSGLHRHGRCSCMFWPTPSRQVLLHVLPNTVTAGAPACSGLHRHDRCSCMFWPTPSRQVLL
ncbi:hypothetical protein LSAT2_025111, partial [Lamellibrachia satsuma]